MLAGEVAYVAETLNYFRIHEGSVRNRFRLWQGGIVEWLRVARWVLDQAPPSDDFLSNIYAYHANVWVPAILSMEVSWRVKGEIFRRARAIDPHPIRSAARPALATVQRKIQRHWRELRSMISPART